MELLSQDLLTSMHSKEPNFIPDHPDFSVFYFSIFICVEHITLRAQSGYGIKVTVTLLIYDLKWQRRADNFLTFRNQLGAIYYRSFLRIATKLLAGGRTLTHYLHTVYPQFVPAFPFYKQLFRAPEFVRTTLQSCNLPLIFT